MALLIEYTTNGFPNSLLISQTLSNHIESASLTHVLFKSVELNIFMELPFPTTITADEQRIKDPHLLPPISLLF